MGYLNSSGYYAWFSFVKSLPLNSEFGTSEFDILSAKTDRAHPHPAPKHTVLSGVKGTLLEVHSSVLHMKLLYSQKRGRGNLISHKTEKFRASDSIRCRCRYANDFRN